MNTATQQDQDDEVVEITNEHGFPETGLWDNGRWFPLCSQCQSHKMANRGQGTACESCQYQDLLECEHDADYFGGTTQITASDTYNSVMRKEFCEELAAKGVTIFNTLSGLPLAFTSQRYLVRGVHKYRSVDVVLMSPNWHEDVIPEKVVYAAAMYANRKGWKTVFMSEVITEKGWRMALCNADQLVNLHFDKKTFPTFSFPF